MHNYNENKKKLKMETETINKEVLLTQSKKRKFVLSRTTTKPFNIRNNNDSKFFDNKYIPNHINDNINNIKPINLFLKDKNNIKSHTKKMESQKNLAYIQMEKIINDNNKEKKCQNLVNKLKLPNISYNNIHNTRKTKRKIKMLI